MNQKELEIPNGYEMFDEIVMTGFDLVLIKYIEKRLKRRKIFSIFARWNIQGFIWWKKSKFYCKVWRDNCLLETIIADTLKEIMAEVSEKYRDIDVRHFLFETV